MAATPDPEVKHFCERLHISAKVMQPHTPLVRLMY
jgi:hypothetical protein